MSRCPACLLLIGAWWCAAAAAPVYRCAGPAGPVYTDQPCTHASQPHALPPIGVLPAGPQLDLEAQHDARRKDALDQRRRDDKAWLKSHRAQQVRTEKVRAAQFAGRVLRDMSADEVRLALGSPDEVQRDGERERWVYRQPGKRRVVTLQSGRVTSTGGK